MYVGIEDPYEMMPGKWTHSIQNENDLNGELDNSKYVQIRISNDK